MFTSRNNPSTCGLPVNEGCIVGFQEDRRAGDSHPFPSIDSCRSYGLTFSSVTPSAQGLGELKVDEGRAVDLAACSAVSPQITHCHSALVLTSQPASLSLYWGYLLVYLGFFGSDIVVCVPSGILLLYAIDSGE